MARGVKILFLFLFVLWGNLLSQQLSHQVLLPLAGVASNGNLSYSQTVGETAVEVVSGSAFVLTQGFQQPCINFSGEKPPEGNGVKVYPNPATDFIKIELFGEVARSFRIDLINISGAIIWSEKFVFTGKFWHHEEVPAEKLVIGLYFIRVISDDGLINRIFKIEKL
jgi:hypothetical protein